MENEAKIIFKSIVEGVNYLHKSNIAHRDLKPDNILIEEKYCNIQNLDFKIKIIDFGFSVETSSKKLKQFCGTPSYMSPEIVTKKEYCGKESDVWALGVILYNLIYGRCPFRAQTEKELYRKISKGNFNFPDETYSKMEEFSDLKVSDKAKSLIKKIFQQRGSQRPTCQEILNDEWFN